LYSWLCPWIFKHPDYEEEPYAEEEEYADDYAA
jgi:hypothetical protein